MTLSFDTMKRSLLREAPGWPSELAEDLSRWPLKGPGTVTWKDAEVAVVEFFVNKTDLSISTSMFDNVLHT